METVKNIGLILWPWALAGLIAHFLYPAELKGFLYSLGVMAIAANATRILFWKERMMMTHTTGALAVKACSFPVKVFVFFAFMAGLTSCYDPHAQESKIVREVEAAGSGNISTYTIPGLTEWFSHRPELTTKIANECAPIAVTAPANWTTSAEGSVCYVATRLAPPPPILADQRTF